MINGNASEFIEELTYQDHYAYYQGKNTFLMDVSVNVMQREIL